MRCLLLVVLLISLCVCTVADHINEQEKLSAVEEVMLETRAATKVEAQSKSQTQSQATATITNKIQEHASKDPHKSEAASAKEKKVTPQKLHAALSDDDSSIKPWIFVTTDTTLTMSWIAFAIIIVAPCFIGISCGWLTRKYCTERGNQRHLPLPADVYDT